MTTTSIDARSLPRPLRRGLERIDRKLRGLAFVRGLGLVAIAMAALAVAGMAADFLWPLPIAARWGMWGAWIAAGLAVLVAFAFVPLLRRVHYGDLAAVAERGDPGLGERIVGAVSLLGERDRAQGSPEFIAALGEDAARRAEGADLSAAVSRRSAAWSAVLGLAAVGLVAAPALVRPDPFRALAERFLMPWGAVERVSRFVVEVTPGDAVVALGSDVTIAATVRPRFDSSAPPEAASLEWTTSDGQAHRRAMTPDEDGAIGARGFRLTLPRLAESVRYRVVAGSAEGRRHALTAVEPPAVAAISATVHPPAYTKRPASAAKDAARIEAWEGSRIELAITANKPLAKARVAWPAPAESESEHATRSVPLETKDGGRTWIATVAADVSGNYAFALEDEHKIANAAEPPRRLIVRPDAPPALTLGGSSDPKEAQGDDLLVVEIAARDDAGVMTCELLYAIARADTSGAEPEAAIPVELAGLGTRAARGEASLGLKGLDLKPGDAIAYRVRVADNRPAPKGPNVTVSAPRGLRIVAKAEPLLTRESTIERQALRDRIEAIKKAAAENRQGAEALRYAADAALRGNGLWGVDRKADLTRREADARAVADDLRTLARDLDASGRFAPLARPARQAADLEAEGGRAKLDAALRAADDAQRLADLRAADDRLAAVQVRVDEILRRFDELARLDDDRRKLRDLAEKEDDLARRADEAAEQGDRGALERLQQEQDQLRGQVDELARRSPELKAEALAARAKEADELARKARELAERQREEARKTADPEGRAAKLRGLAEAQRKLEDDARRLALEVDRPLEENGRGRLDAGSLARAVEPIERGEIEQGRQRLDEAEAALRRLERDLEDVRDDPKALARRLARRQDALGNQVAEAVREARDPEQKKALADKLRPFAAREEAIRKLAAALPVPENLKDQARDAVQALDRAVEDLNKNGHEQVQNHQNEARDRLNRLADALPDGNQRRQQAMQALNEAKGRVDQVARELDQHLRETAPRPDQRDFDPDAAARELARRVAPLATRQAEAARLLAEMQPDRRAEPQRDRALDRARDLADALDALRDSAPPEPRPEDAKANGDWRVLGAFDDAKKFPPFAIDRPIDLKAPFEGRKGTSAVWKPVQSGGDGRVDLGALYGRENNACAFAYAEVASPARGRGRLLVGSDDTLTIWLNGKRVYEFKDNRPWSRDQDRVDVTFEEGPNRLLVQCGNVSSEWAFSVAVQPPMAPGLAHRADHARRVRESLPALKADAAAAVERLQQKMVGQEPADDRAADLAAEMKAPPAGPDAPSPAEEARRAATALRNLKAPDAAAHLAEAIRRAERAAEKTAADAPDAAQSREAAAKAADALARRLADALSPRERAEALSRAQKGLAEPEAARDPRDRAEAQRAIADELAALPADSPRQDAAVEAARKAADLAERRAQRPDAAPSTAALDAAGADAAQAIDALAQALNEPAANPAEPPKGPTARARAQDLAARQKALADRAQALGQKAAAAPKDDRAAAEALAPDLAALARDQEALADATRALDDPLPGGSPPRREAETRRDGARAAQAQAAGALEARDPAKAAERARAAAEALDQLAQGFPEADPAPDPANAPAPADPELALNPEHAAEARALARRERQIRERLQAVLGERVAPQEAVRQQSADLGREFADLRDATRDLSNRSQAPANAAADLLQNQAPRAMNEGMEHLAAGRADQARDTQRRAAEALERAAQQAEDLAGAIRGDSTAEALAQAEAQGEGQPEQADLASARDAQREASQQLAQAREGAGDPAASKAASDSMRQAAKGLRAAARGKPAPGPGQAQPALASSDSSDPDPKEGEAGRDAPSLAELKEAIKTKTGRNWGELPGHLRSEILQMSQGKYRDDYARLIALYFREIAAGREGDGDKP